MKGCTTNSVQDSYALVELTRSKTHAVHLTFAYITYKSVRSCFVESPTVRRSSVLGEC